MSAPRSKTVVVGGKDFVVRPLLGEVNRAMMEGKRVDGSALPKGGTDEDVAVVAIILKRTDPTVTEEWLLKNGDMGEYRDVLGALREVTGGRGRSRAELLAELAALEGTAEGEAPAP